MINDYGNINHLSSGTKLSSKSNQYTIQKALGQGGFGIVYSALDKQGNKVAIKEYFPSSIAARSRNADTVVTIGEDMDIYFRKGVKRFYEEAKTMARFKDDKNIVDVKDFFQANGTAYIVMEFINGMTLLQILNAQPKHRLPLENVLIKIQPVIEALERIHSTPWTDKEGQVHEGTIHRDISPDNIMFSADGSVKLMDFGAARTVSTEGQFRLTGYFKAGYAPLEQFIGSGKAGAQGSWTDVYALAATIYHAITGKRPVSSQEREVQINSTGTDPLKNPSTYGIGITPQQETALLKGLELDYHNRYQTVTDFMKDLTKGMKSSPKKEPARNKAKVVTKEEAPTQVKMEMEPIDALPAGTKLINGDNKYTVQKAVNRNCFAYMYKGIDEKGNDVFIEELFPDGVVGRLNDKVTVCLKNQADGRGDYFTEYMECFQEKVRKLSFLEKDENIIKIEDAFWANSTQYIVTEYLEGKSFLDILNILPEHRLGLEETIANLMPVFKTLVRMHRILWKKCAEEKDSRMLFNGIAPENIIFTNSGAVKLIGIENNLLTQIDNRVFELTSRSLISYPYIAPEAFQKSKQLGPWSDVYSLAATIYRAITGKKPQEARNRLINDQLQLLLSSNIKIEAKEEKILLRGLMLNYRYRYQSVEEFMNALQKNSKDESKTEIKTPDKLKDNTLQEKQESQSENGDRYYTIAETVIKGGLYIILGVIGLFIIFCVIAAIGIITGG